MLALSRLEQRECNVIVFCFFSPSAAATAIVGVVMAVEGCNYIEKMDSKAN